MSHHTPHEFGPSNGFTPSYSPTFGNGYGNGYTNGNGNGNGHAQSGSQISSMNGGTNWTPPLPASAFVSVPTVLPAGVSTAVPGGFMNGMDPMSADTTPTDPTRVSVSPVRPTPTTTTPPSPTQQRLADLVVRAETSIEELERLASTALDATAASAQAATDLQERLRLGVRMLQAFDVQIQRCEQMNTQASPQMGMQIAAQFTNQMNAVAQHCELRVRAALEMLDRRLNESVPFLDERLRQAHEQVGRIVEERITTAERRIDERYGPARDELRRFADELAAGFAARLDAIVGERDAALSRAQSMPQVNAQDALLPLASMEERVRTLLSEAERRSTGVEDTLASADTRLRALIRESTDAADGLLGTLGTATTLKDLIADEARASRRLADEAHTASRELQRELHDLLERCTIAKSSLDQQIHDVRSAAADAESHIAAAKTLRGEIEETIRQIKPLESSLRPDAAPMQQVVDSISSNVRQSLAEDMRNFSAALRGLASRAEHAFATARFDEFSAMPESMMTTPAPFVHEPMPTTPTQVVSASPALAAALNDQVNGVSATDVHTGSISTLPVDTRRLTAEIMALDATSLLRPPTRTTH